MEMSFLVGFPRRLVIDWKSYDPKLGSNVILETAFQENKNIIVHTHPPPHHHHHHQTSTNVTENGFYNIRNLCCYLNWLHKEWSIQLF